VINKFRLLCHRDIVITSTEQERVIRVPLINEDTLKI
jgi:hypothetical protein